MSEHKSMTLVYQNKSKAEKGIFSRVRFNIEEWSIQYLGIKLRKYLEDIYEEKYQIFKK